MLFELYAFSVIMGVGAACGGVSVGEAPAFADDLALHIGRGKKE